MRPKKEDLLKSRAVYLVHEFSMNLKDLERGIISEDEFYEWLAGMTSEFDSLGDSIWSAG